MKNIIALLVLFLGLIILQGCGGNEEEPLARVPATIPESSKQIKKIFDAAPERVKIKSNELVRAYEDGKLEDAAGLILQLERDRELSFDQSMAIRNSRSTLEANLAKGVEAGDPEAIAAFNRLKGAASN